MRWLGSVVASLSVDCAILISDPTDASLCDGLVSGVLLQRPYLLTVLSYLTDASLCDGLVL